jgi:Rrf2 family protein
MLSRKTRYAILALVRLARVYGQGPMMISDIAHNEMIPKRFLENILLECKKFGFVGSKAGKSGGYYLIKDPKSVNLAQIIELFEGAITLVPCISKNHYQPCEFCHDEKDCKIRDVFQDIGDNTYQRLSAANLAELI